MDTQGEASTACTQAASSRVSVGNSEPRFAVDALNGVERLRDVGRLRLVGRRPRDQGAIFVPGTKRNAIETSSHAGPTTVLSALPLAIVS